MFQCDCSRVAQKGHQSGDDYCPLVLYEGLYLDLPSEVILVISLL